MRSDPSQGLTGTVNTFLRRKVKCTFWLFVLAPPILWAAHPLDSVEFYLTKTLQLVVSLCDSEIVSIMLKVIVSVATTLPFLVYDACFGCWQLLRLLNLCQLQGYLQWSLRYIIKISCEWSSTFKEVGLNKWPHIAKRNTGSNQCVWTTKFYIRLRKLSSRRGWKV